ncbi:MAG TPA: type II secretion system protein [Burkholderiales bacterium]|nr:type II secretion system protein [Burkholderiales bacterium]
MRSSQRGFTLIELVVVIVILGILAATALPKFINLSGEARQAAVKGVAAAATSGFAINYAGRKASAANTTAINGANATAICTSAVLGSVMTGGFPATGYTISAGTNQACSATSNDGATGTCTIQDTQLSTASATVTYICANP